MDCVCSYSKISLPQLKNTLLSSTLFSQFKLQSRKSLAVVAMASASSSNNGLNVPLVVRTATGRSLSGFLQNDRELFDAFVEKELVKLAYMRDDACLRMNLSLCSDQYVLHRRIFDLRKLECREAVEDVMYMLIVYKFSKIGVHLVPKLSKCIYNGRLEIWPCKDWELDSIHNVEVLEMVKVHLSTVIGWKDKSNVKDNWALTQFQKLQIRQAYTASILYGYFLKSASLRYHLEQSFDRHTRSNLLFSRSWPLRQNNARCVSDKHEKFRSYIMSLDDEIVQMCAKPKFKEAMSLIEKHCSALFDDESDNDDEVVSTSMASMKRFVLEAVAFGSFLWDAEDHIRAFYRLEEN